LDEIIDVEERCLPVRRGEGGRIEELMGRYLDPPGGLGRLKAFMGTGVREEIDNGDRFACSELLLQHGRRREALRPLEQVIEDKRTRPSLRELAMCRVSQMALENAIPLDLRPLLAELGMGNGGLRASLMKKRGERGRKKHPLVLLEKELLRGMVLAEGALEMESDSEAAKLSEEALGPMEHALSISDRIAIGSAEQEGITDHHRCRCLLAIGGHLASIGDEHGSRECLSEAFGIAESNGFQHMAGVISVRLAMLSDDPKTAALACEKAGRTRDPLLLAEAIAIRGERLCSSNENAEKEDRGEGMVEGVDLLIEASKRAAPFSDILSRKYLTEAAIWLNRASRPKRALEVIRKAAGGLDRRSHRELYMAMKAVSIRSRLLLGDRKRAKKELLELLYEHPVKENPRAYNLLWEAVEDQQWLRKDGQTRVLFEDKMVCYIDRPVIEEIISRAKRAHPNEFGAMLRGMEHITHIEPIMEGAGGRSQFMFSLFSRFSQRSVPGEGVVHSHPSGSARPSGADLSMFGRFPGINIIIGYPYREDSMAAYDRLGNRVELVIWDGPGAPPVR